MKAHKIGIISLLFDAIYCITVGIGIMLAATYVAPIIGIPVLLTIAIGCATTVWGIGIVGMMRTIPLATALTTVMLVNLCNPGRSRGHLHRLSLRPRHRRVCSQPRMGARAGLELH